MAIESSPLAGAILCMAAVYVAVALFPYYSNAPTMDNTSSVEIQTASIGAVIIGLFNPYAHPIASLLAIVTGALILYRQTSD